MWALVYINQDAFVVPLKEYYAKVAEAMGDWTIVSEWIEQHYCVRSSCFESRSCHQNSCLPLERGSQD